MKEFEELVDQHYESLYRFGYSLSKNAEQSSDLVQQAFCVWAAKGHQLKDRTKAKTWLFTTLYREFLTQRRKKQRFVDTELSELDHVIPADESVVERQLDAKKAVEMLGQLDESFRAPLTLFYLQQHSYKEIAEILEIPMGTVMSRISRAKTQLKSMMLKEQEPKIIPFNARRERR